MARSRLDLHEELCALLGSTNVYFQPPESKKMKYPCIVYERSTGDTIFADNRPYRFTPRYSLTLIGKDPDSPLVRKIAEAFPMCRYNRHFEVDNLNHDTFELYY